MKKLILVTALIIAFAAIVTSCNDDKEVYSEIESMTNGKLDLVAPTTGQGENDEDPPEGSGTGG